MKIDQLEIYKPKPRDTLGIPRNDMPQIHADDFKSFIKYLKKNDAKIIEKTVNPKSLKATQDEFSDKSILKQIELFKEDTPKKPIIVSLDNYILDGHHRWLGAWNAKKKILIYKVNLEIKELFLLVDDFPKTTHKEIHEAKLMLDKIEIYDIMTQLAEDGHISIENDHTLKEAINFL